MDIKKLWNRAAALLCAVAMAVTWIPNRAWGAEPYIEVSDVSVSAGGSCVVCIRGKNLVNLSSIELSVHYDETVMSVSSAPAANLDTFDVNTATAGEIRLVGVSESGLNDSVTLMNVYFQIKSNAPVGKYLIQVAVGEAYDTERTELSIASSGGIMTITEASTYQKSAYFHSNFDKASLQKGEEATLRVYCYSLWNDVTAGKMTVTYDPEKLSFVSAAPFPNTSGVTATTDGTRSGLVSVSFASPNAIATNHFLEVKLKAIADEAGTTTIEFAAGDFYDGSKNPVTCNGFSYNLTLQKVVEVGDNPDMTVTIPDTIRVGVPFTATVSLEGRSALAAGDFCISYDTSKLRCLTAEKAKSVENAYVIVNQKFSEGQIHFSVLSGSGIASDTDLLTLRFIPSSIGAFSLTPGATTNSVNIAREKVTLEMVSAAGTVLKNPDSVTVSGQTGQTSAGTATLLDKEGTILHSVSITEGTYTISCVPFGDYTIELQQAGCVTRKVQVSIGKADEPTLQLQIGPVSVGDVNGDHLTLKKGGVGDMQSLYTYLSTGVPEGTLQKEADYFQTIADVNGDGTVNILDYQALYELVRAQ